MNIADELLRTDIGALDPSGHTRSRRAGPFILLMARPVPDEGGIREQTRGQIEDLREVLEAAGGGLENLVDVTTYLADIEDYPAYNAAYAAFFAGDGPARTTVAVERLTRAGQRIQMRGVAYILSGPKPNP